MVEYISAREEQENNFTGCPTKSYITQISSWNPDEIISIGESVKYFSNLDGISKINISEYKKVQDVTPLSITDFYNTFKTSSSNKCVQTPKKLWISAIE